KLCDQISGAVLDAHLRIDPDAKVACECVAKTGMILFCGGISSQAIVDYQQIIILKNFFSFCEFVNSLKLLSLRLDCKTYTVLVALEQRCKDIKQADPYGETGDDIGAGDQGLMFGYATDETEEYKALIVLLAHKLTASIRVLEWNGTWPWVGPDGKTQVTMEYKECNGALEPIQVHTLVISVNHAPDIPLQQVRNELKEKVVKKSFQRSTLMRAPFYDLLPSEKFV
ncbi:METK2 synthase, partial [Leiothrix lutea]|nr:METK2 synthase [Leiothrix lutea]